MHNNTNTWALSPREVALRMTLLACFWNFIGILDEAYFAVELIEETTSQLDAFPPYPQSP